MKGEEEDKMTNHDGQASASRLNQVDTNFQAVQNNHEVASPEYRTDGGEGGEGGEGYVGKNRAAAPEIVDFTTPRDYQACPSCGCRLSDVVVLGSEAEKLQAMEKFAGDTQAIIKRKRLHADEKLRMVLELLAKLMGDLAQGKEKTQQAVKDEQVGSDMMLALPGHEQQTPKSDKKRKRHKFTNEQLNQLGALGERVHWVLGNLAKEEQEQFANSIGIKVESLRYWFHNTKQKHKKMAGPEQ